MKNTMAIVLSRTRIGFEPLLYDLETTAALTDTHPQLIVYYVELGLVEPAETVGDRYYFSDSSIARIRRIFRLRRDLGVNINGVDVVLHLLDQIDELHREMQRLRRNLQVSLAEIEEER